MSARNKCTCGRKHRDHEDLVVTKFKCNNSAFNGYHTTSSNYSAVHCIRPGCYGSWRTNASYANSLPWMSIDKVVDDPTIRKDSRIKGGE